MSFLILMINMVFVSGVLVFCLNYRHLLINLISLEFMMLGLFLFCYIFLLKIKFELVFSMIFLAFMVSEGVLGLSLLIVMVRVIGNNYYQSLNLFKW